MASTTDRFTSLLDEMGSIEDLAESMQSGEPSEASDVDQLKITELQEQYLDWYERALSTLNDVGRKNLASFYSGNYRCIHRYISDPVAAEYGLVRTSYGQTRNQYYWKNRFDENFREPFNEQRMLLMRIRAKSVVRAAYLAAPPPPAIETIRLHSRIKAVSTDLFMNGHYRQAIFQACLALNEAVQQRSHRLDLDGSALMQQVFSANTPVLRFTGHPDEQKGYMWLFAGVMMAIRNPRAHHLGESEDLDANEALELLAMVSALYRALDSAEVPETTV